MEEIYFLFQLHQFTIIGNTCFNIKNDKYKVNKTYRFLINERGKTRVIDAPHIKDRLVHKVITNEILIPLYEPHLIYDNGASQMNKGFIFAVYRVKKKLREYYNKFGYNGYVILLDFSKFFENCSHEVIHNIHKKYVVNDYTIKVIEDYLFIGKGIALGVEIAQREASMIPNLLDHLLSNNSFFTCRYMDDTICIIDDIDKARYMLGKYKCLCNILDIKINTNKT